MVIGQLHLNVKFFLYGKVADAAAHALRCLDTDVNKKRESEVHTYEMFASVNDSFNIL